jgi:hypothetical protein
MLIGVLLAVAAALYLRARIVDAEMVKRTNQEVGNITDAFVEGTGGWWDWDDFCSFKIEDQELDAVRVKCCNLSFAHPPLPGDGYCNEAGIQLLREIAKDLRKLPE